MLHWAAVFFLLSLVAALLGFTGFANSSAPIFQIQFVVFLILGALSLIFAPLPARKE
jgi:uncharacterized membrane protein YtjA (UPF0391 family)